MLAALVGIVGTAVCVGYFIDTANARPRPKRYRAAVMRVLDTQRVEHRDVEVADGCAPSYQLCESYAGTVRVLTATTMSGQITCRERLTIPEARISDVLLEDTRDPLFARCEELYVQLLLWLRVVYSSFA